MAVAGGGSKDAKLGLGVAVGLGSMPTALVRLESVVAKRGFSMFAAALEIVGRVFTASLEIIGRLLVIAGNRWQSISTHTACAHNKSHMRLDDYFMIR